MSAHTPGPWNIVSYMRADATWAPGGIQTHLVSPTESADGHMILARNAGVCEIKRGLSSALADARLIAAAPDMLAALKECLTALERIRTAKLVPFHVCDVGYGTDRVRSAIARAEGR